MGPVCPRCGGHSIHRHHDAAHAPERPRETRTAALGRPSLDPRLQVNGRIGCSRIRCPGLGRHPGLIPTDRHDGRSLLELIRARGGCGARAPGRCMSRRCGLPAGHHQGLRTCVAQYVLAGGRRRIRAPDGNFRTARTGGKPHCKQQCKRWTESWDLHRADFLSGNDAASMHVGHVAARPSQTPGNANGRPGAAVRGTACGAITGRRQRRRQPSRSWPWPRRPDLP